VPAATVTLSPGAVLCFQLVGTAFAASSLRAHMACAALSATLSKAWASKKALDGRLNLWERSPSGREPVGVPKPGGCCDINQGRVSHAAVLQTWPVNSYRSKLPWTQNLRSGSAISCRSRTSSTFLLHVSCPRVICQQRVVRSTLRLKFPESSFDPPRQPYDPGQIFQPYQPRRGAASQVQ
jgi:hypothetical protein